VNWFGRRRSNEEPDDAARPADLAGQGAPVPPPVPTDPGEPREDLATALPRPPEPGPMPAPVPMPEPAPAPAPAREGVRPITRQRVEACLREQGYRYRVAADSSLIGNWDGDSFVISLIGEREDILQVRGTWHGTIEADLAPGIALVVNDWNRDRIWPKVYTRPVSGGLQAVTEVSMDLAPGATDLQITEAVACGLGTGVQFFAALTDLLATEKDLQPPDG
jgi:Putative bacterial sensory transduction regulator